MFQTLKPLGRIVLASGSPRRKEILKTIGVEFEVVPSTFEEKLDKSTFKHPSGYVAETARQKALEVYQRLRERPEDSRPKLIIGADTIVVSDDHILEKPRDSAHAFQMLKSLSGRSHVVYTAVALVSGSDDDVEPSCNVEVEMTTVHFEDLTDDMIRAYIDSGEHSDKAGAYGIQGSASIFVKKIDGDYFNVVGFPSCRFFRMLRARDFKS